MNTTIVFYSRTGNTCLIAEILADALDGQLVSIHATGTRYRGALSAYVMGSLHAVFGFGSPFELSIAIPSETDLLIIGSPVWYNNVVPPVRSFLLQHKQTRFFAFFSTSRRASKKCIRSMQNLVQNSANVIAMSNFQFETGYSEAKLAEEVKNWAAVLRQTFSDKELSYVKKTSKN